MSGYPRPRAATRAHRLKIPPILVICTLLLLSLALTSAPVQAAPPIANDDRYTVDEDSLDNRLDVLANDRDPDGDTLKVITVTQGLYGNVLIIDGGDRVSYAPKPEFYGDDFFTYRVDDGHGGSDTARVDVTVRGINDPPIAQDDQAVTKEDNDVTVDVLVNDSDSDGDLDPSTVTRISGPSHGSATVLGSTGVISYTPNLNWYGDDAFTYEVCDDGTPLPPRCDTATVSVTVIEENDPPVANAGPDQSAKTNANVTLDGSGSYDLEGDLPLT